MAKYVVDDYIYNKEKELFIADKDFTASLLPKFLFKKALGIEGDIINFSRFTMAPYDQNPMRWIHQLRADLVVYRAYMKYKI